MANTKTVKAAVDMLFLDLADTNSLLHVGQNVSFDVKCTDPKMITDVGGFPLNFQAFHEDYANIALQFNPQAPSSTIQLNTRVNKTWKKELLIHNERVDAEYFGATFRLRIEVRSINYILIYINEQFLTGYHCFTDITAVKYLCYVPGVAVDVIQH